MRVEQTPLWVVKIGGRLCEDADMRAALARACAAAPQARVIVHGGGCMVTDMQQALGMQPKFVDGRRATQREEMDVVEMVLSGSINKQLVRALQAAGRSAVGLSGVDGGMVRCEVVTELGAVGVPKVVHADVLHSLLAAGMTCVVSPVSLGPEGAALEPLEPLNVNADEFACAVAAALGAERLLLLSDVPAVRVAGAAQELIAVDQVEGLIAAGEVTGGMMPKLRSAARAVQAGVQQVRIAGFGEDLAQVQGTVIVPAGQAVQRVG